ncbi:calcium uniporter regulatory subunit MCUb, mitochondrial [Oncorhynchus tshawytscha]|uniref:calcium uniporter regulatory subunit MCUb, mitochondrial n=1 Tax=Oncorhynchus tshawytscha TaxID=74940 RepID=UPI001C3E60F0|nr:calcium uniporter regulatory subunit MCUb, mitochondrial [Oncorhynchus tshawytscha]
MIWFGRVAKLHYGVLRCSLSSASGKSSSAIQVPYLSRQWCRYGAPRPGHYYSTLPPATGNSDISIQYKYGRPVLSLPLPSRSELCQFSLRPMLMTVTDFLSDIQREDPGVAIAAVLNTDGERVCSSTSIDTVLNQDFQILINSTIYRIHSRAEVPNSVCVYESPEHSTSIDDMKTVVHMLQSALNLPEHQLLRQIQLLRRLDTLKQELGPLEEVLCGPTTHKHTQTRGLQTHTNTRITDTHTHTGINLCPAVPSRFVFAWDVMEPVTYFITYATSMGFLGYYILTKQELLYPDAKDRQFLHFFHKRAAMEHFDTHRYNALRDQLAMVESDLKRLRKPIQLQLPVDPIQPSN